MRGPWSRPGCRDHRNIVHSIKPFQPPRQQAKRASAADSSERRGDQRCQCVLLQLALSSVLQPQPGPSAHREEGARDSGRPLASHEVTHTSLSSDPQSQAITATHSRTRTTRPRPRCALPMCSPPCLPVALPPRLPAPGCASQWWMCHTRPWAVARRACSGGAGPRTCALACTPCKRVRGVRACVPTHTRGGRAATTHSHTQPCIWT